MPADATVQLSFTGGPDQRTAAEYVDPSQRLISVVNGVYTHEGAVDKRLGVQYLPTTQLSGDPTMGAPLRLVSRRQALAMTDGDSLFSYSPGAGVWSWRSLVSPCVATREHLYTSTGGFTGFTVSEGNGVRSIVYRTSTGASQAGDVYVTVQDATTGDPVLLAHKLTSGATNYNPIGIIQGTYLYVFYADTSHIYGAVLNLSTMAWTAPVTIVSDLYSTNQISIYDATPYVGGSGILIAYSQTPGAYSNLRYLRLEQLPGLAITASATITSNTSGVYVTRCACRYDGTLGVVWFAWEDFGGTTYTLNAQPFNTSWSSTHVIFGVNMSGYSGSSSVAVLSVEPLTSSTVLFTGEPAGTPAQAVYNSSGSQLSTVAYPSSLMVGRPFRATVGSATRCYVPIAYLENIVSSGTFTTSYFLVDTRAFEAGASPNPQPRVVATLAPRQGNYIYADIDLTLDGHLPTVTNIGVPTAGTFKGVIIVNPSEEFTNQTGTTAPVFIDLATFDFTEAANWQVAEGDSETYVSGGTPGYYEGTLQELGFFAWPTGLSSSITASGGNLQAGQYQYAFCFGQVDSAGLAHRSATYTATVTIATSGSQVTWTIPNIPYTNRFNGGRAPVVEVYRSEVGQTTLYYVGSVACVSTSNGAVLTYVDGASDSSIATNALLYTTGNALDSVCPPSFQCLVRHNQRLWGIDDTGSVIWFSTAFNGSDAPYFNEALTLTFADGPLTALATLDDKLIVFSATRIWIITGDGPAITGQGSDLSNPVPVQSDVGAIDWRSVASTPLGVFFQAPMGGIYLLGRDLSVTYIGKQVQDYVGPHPTQTNASFNTVLAAALVPSSNHVRFVLTDGTVLFYDYVMQRWGLHASFNGGATTATTGTVDASGQWYMAGSDGLVYREKSPITDAAPWFDTTIAGRAWITTSVITAWIKLAGLQGYQRARHILALADWMEAADVEVWARFDYAAGTAYDQQQWFAYSALSAANAAQAQMDMHVKAMSTRSQAVQVELKDRAPTGGTATTGQGVRFLGLNFDCQVTGSRNRRLGSGVKA